MKPVTLKKILSIILALFFLFQIKAQSPHFKNFNILKGKKNFTVNIVYQDHLGYLWFGTSEGLIKYNGINYQYLTKENNLPDNNITCITEDNKNNLWLGCNNGKISYYDGVSFTSYNLLDSLLSEKVSKILINDSIKWIASVGNGLFKIKNNQITQFNSESDIGDDYIYDIEKDSFRKPLFGF
jgi:ligand-binding sensor domain-containing protein